MSTLADLQTHTNTFLELHWPGDAPRPRWSESPWRFEGAIPQQEARGCYALIGKHGEVLYVGVGAGRNAGRYEGAGLGARLHRYWQKDPETPRLPDGTPKYAPTSKYTEVREIATIGFRDEAKELWYLAYALEPFLISKLNPEMNTVWRR